MASNKLSKQEQLVMTADKVSALWMDFRKSLQSGFLSREITPADEQHFLEIKSNLSRLQRLMSQRLPEGVHYGSKRMTQIMSQAVSIAALREMPLNDKKSLYQLWHDANIALESVRGVIDVIVDGFPVTIQATTQVRSGNIKQEMSGSKGKKKSKAGPIAVLVVIVVAAAAWWYYKNNM